jgi:hypothetical protein
MTVISTQQSAYVYEANAVNKTNSTSQVSSSSSTGEVNRLEQMKEKYKDVYTPIPETYSKADEDLQTKKVYEAYPNYITLNELWAKRESFYVGEPIQLGVKPTKEQEEAQKVASEKIDAWIKQEYGSLEAFDEVVQGGQNIINKYPTNQWAKDNVPNAKELARFNNAVVYEALESGKTLEEAKKYAGSIRETFISMNAKEGMPNTYKPDFSSAINSVWNLGQYGIDGDWTKNSIYNNDKVMISELEKKINQFNFMLNNEEIIKQADTKLDPSEQNLAQVDHYKEWINEKYLPDAQLALKVFQNYKIYDSVNVKV